MEQEDEKSPNGEIKKTDYIYVETEEYDPGQEFRGHKYKGFQKEFRYSYQKMGTRSYPVSVRIICLLCAIFLFFFLLLATPLVLLFLAINTLTLFQWEAFWQRTKMVAGTYSKILVTTLGLLVGVISPALGISLILVYFMMLGQKSGDVWVEKIFKASQKS